LLPPAVSPAPLQRNVPSEDSFGTLTQSIKRLPISSDSDPRRLIIAFLPPPFVDELLGSWLERVALVNALESPMTLLRMTGLNRALCNAQTMDIPQPTQRWVDLFTHLDVDSQWATNALSTYPYWRCLETRRNLPPSTLGQSRLLEVRRSHARHWLQLCPSCVAHDLEHLGVTYLRRAHQLPATIVCHEHGDRLISRCGACNAILRPAVMRKSFDLASRGASCACGWDLRHGSDQPKPAGAWQVLAIFEKECLNLPAGVLAGEHPRLALAHALRDHDAPATLLSQAYGPDHQQFLPWRLRKLSARNKTTTASMRHLSPPILCAMFTAGGFDSHSALELVKATAGSVQSHQPRRTRATLMQPTSLEEAKDCVRTLRAQGYAQTWGELRHKDRFVFWFLALQGWEWLVEQFGQPRLSLKIPTIEHDREALRSGTASFTANLEAAARAHCRDRAWLARLGKTTKAAVLTARIAEQIRIILAAKAQATAPSAERPQKFTSRHAAAAIGKSFAHVNSLRAHVPPEGEPLYESAADFQWRVLIWAVGERVKRGEPLSGNYVSKEGGLVNTRLIRFMACTVIALFACDDHGQPLGPWVGTRGFRSTTHQLDTPRSSTEGRP